MKVAIDIGPLTSGDKVRGVGFYTKHIIDALQKIETKKSKNRKTNFSITTLDSETIRRRSSEFDIVHIPYFSPYFLTVPTDLSSKLVVTIHDVIPLLYPDKYPSGIKGGVRFIRQKHVVKNIDAVITDSESSKKDITRFLKIDQSKIIPIYLAPGEHFGKVTGNRLEKTRKKFNLPQKFVLYVGDINYNKNIPTLIEACKKAKVKLVIVGKQINEIEIFESDIAYMQGPRDWIRFLFGKPHPEVAHYQQILEYIKEEETVIRTGFVADEELVDIYNLATLYCQPSFAEGFGFPVLEAMACGTPVIASRCQCLVEINEDAAVFTDPKDVDGFTQVIKKVLGNKKIRDQLSKKGLEHVKKFTWEKTAKETIEVYRKVASSQ